MFGKKYDLKGTEKKISSGEKYNSRNGVGGGQKYEFQVLYTPLEMQNVFKFNFFDNSKLTSEDGELYTLDQCICCIIKQN